MKIMKNTHDEPIAFWPCLVTASGVAVRSGKSDVTTSGTSEVKKLEVTRDDPVGFLPSLVTASWKAVRSGQGGVTTSRRPSQNPNRRRDGVTPWADAVSPYFLYI